MKNVTLLFLICFTVSIVMAAPEAEILSEKVICQQPGRYIGWPTIEKGKDGTLYVVFSGDRDSHVCPWGVTQMITSTDNGATWSDPVTINNTPLDDRDAGIMRTRNNTLIVSWFTSLEFAYQFEEKWQNYTKERVLSWQRHIEKISDETREQWLGNWIRRSTDGGLTWGEYIDSKVTAPHGPVQLTDGRQLYVGINKKVGDRKSANPAKAHRIAAAESRDDGKSWQIIGYVPIPEKYSRSGSFSEPHVVEAADGRLVAMFRYSGEPNHYELIQSESFDGGVTWTPLYTSGIWGYPPHLTRLSNDWLLVTYGYRKEPHGERACISRDNGTTWDVDNAFILSSANNSDLGYPASVQLDDGSIYTIYYQAPERREMTVLKATHWRIKE